MRSCSRGRRGEVDLLDPAPCVELGLEDGVVVRWRDAGVVRTDVDAAVLRCGGSVELLDGARIGHVGVDIEAVDRLGELRAALVVEVAMTTCAPSAAKRSAMAARCRWPHR